MWARFIPDGIKANVSRTNAAAKAMYNQSGVEPLRKIPTPQEAQGEMGLLILQLLDELGKRGVEVGPYRAYFDRERNPRRRSGTLYRLVVDSLTPVGGRVMGAEVDDVNPIFSLLAQLRPENMLPSVLREVISFLRGPLARPAPDLAAVAAPVTSQTGEQPMDGPGMGLLARATAPLTSQSGDQPMDSPAMRLLARATAPMTSQSDDQPMDDPILPTATDDAEVPSPEATGELSNAVKTLVENTAALHERIGDVLEHIKNTTPGVSDLVKEMEQADAVRAGPDEPAAEPARPDEPAADQAGPSGDAADTRVVAESPARDDVVEEGVIPESEITDSASSSRQKRRFSDRFPLPSNIKRRLFGEGPPGININGAAEAAKFLEKEPENLAHAELVAEAFSAKERRKKRTGKKAAKAWEGVDWPAYVAEMDAQYQKDPQVEQLTTFMEKKDKLYRPFNYANLQPAKKAKTA